MASKATDLETRLQGAGNNLLKLGAIIGEFRIVQSSDEIDTPEQARELIIRHIDKLKGQQNHHSVCIESRTDRLLSTLRDERRNQINCKKLFEDALSELTSQNKFIQCSLQLHYSDFEKEILKRKRSLEKGNLRILITGEICAGKSSILNMLMGGYYVPVGHGPCTVIPCEVQHSLETKAALHYADAKFSTREVLLETDEKDPVWLQLRACVETGKDKLAETEQRTDKRLKKVVLYWNFPFLNDKHQTHRKCRINAETESLDHDKVINGITFVDAPGIHDTDHTFYSVHEYIEDCDAFLFVINTSQHAGIDRDRLVRLMNDVRIIYQRNNGIFTPRCGLFICNKWDFVDDCDQPKLQKEILNKLQASWARVTDKQVIPFNGSVQALKSVRQGDYSEEYISFNERVCGFVEIATRVKTETHCWWLSTLIERTLAIVCNMQSIYQHYMTNKEMVLGQLQNDIDAVIQAQEKRDAIDRKLTGMLNNDLQMVQKYLQKELKNSKTSLSVWHITDIPRQKDTENWQHLNYKLKESIGMKIETHIRKNTQIECIRNQCSKEVDSSLNEVIKMYAELENQLAFKHEIRDEKSKDLVDLMSESANELTWQEIAGVIVAVVFPLAPILVLILNVLDSVKTPTMLDDEVLFKKDCYYYMQRQTEILIDNTVSSRLSQVSEALLDGQLRNSKFVLKYFRNCLNIKHQLLKELLTKISSRRFEVTRIECHSIQQLSERIQELLIRDILQPEVERRMVFFDPCEKDRLGEGAFGNVYRGKLQSHIEDRDVAVKIIKWPKGKGKCPDDVYIYRECFNLRMLSAKPEALRKNVVDFYGEFDEVSSTCYSLYIVMELCDGNSDSLIKKKQLTVPSCSYSCLDFPGKDQTQIESIGYIVYLAEQAAMGIQFLHDNNVVHRDIKPHNFLIKYVNKDTVVKICDFGMSRDHISIKSVRCVGTPLYNSPEMLAGNISTFASDIYSFGLVIWELWYGERVFQELSLQEVRDPRRKAPLMNVIQPPAPLKKLMLSMWKKDEEDRPNASSVVDTLKQLRRSISVETTVH